MAPARPIIHLSAILLPPPHSVRMGLGLHPELRCHCSPDVPICVRTFHRLLAPDLHNRILHHREAVWA